MSTQTLKQPLVGGISTGRNNTFAGWLKHFWAKLLLGKWKLLIGGGFMAAIVLAGFYFGNGNYSFRSDNSVIRSQCFVGAGTCPGNGVVCGPFYRRRGAL